MRGIGVVAVADIEQPSVFSELGKIPYIFQARLKKAKNLAGTRH